MFRYEVTPMLSVRPSKISLTNMFRKQTLNEHNHWVDVLGSSSIAEQSPAPATERKKEPLKKAFHNFSISVNSQRNLRDKIQYLFQFAKGRNIKTANGKNLKNFKVCFLTLTLPSAQKHPTAEITKTCLDEFLQRCRKYLGMRNYVWRLEFQANGNVHYHIVTDTYVCYYWARKEWNSCLEQLGYVSAYANKMNGLSFTDYSSRYADKYNGNAQKLYKSYGDGRANNWRQPNSVDVKSAKGSDNISYYISKYFSKKEKTAVCNSLDNESNSFALRLCFWSRSLSACKAESMPLDYYSADIVNLFTKYNIGKKVLFDYCTVIYYSFNELPSFVKMIIGHYFNKLRDEIEYLPAC